MVVTEQMEIADLIRHIRRRLRLTQEKFAAKVGVTCLTVNRWENGHTKPSPLALKQIEGMLQEMGGGRSPSRRHRGQDLLKRHLAE